MNRRTAYTTDDAFHHGVGYLFFVGALQVCAGLLSILFSGLVAMRAGSAGFDSLSDPQVMADCFAGRGSEGFASMVAGFVAFQVTYGWIFGLLLVVAGICSLKCRGKWFVWLSTVANLVNFPHGTTVALIVWHGLTRQSISQAFSRDDDEDAGSAARAH